MKDPEKISEAIRLKSYQERKTASLVHGLARLLDVSIIVCREDEAPVRYPTITISRDSPLEQLKFVWSFFSEVPWPKDRVDTRADVDAPIIFGFDSDLFCKMLAMDLLPLASLSVDMPEGFWKDNRFAVDPIQDLTGSRSRALPEIRGKMYLVNNHILDKTQGWEPHADAKTDCDQAFAAVVSYRMMEFGTKL